MKPNPKTEQEWAQALESIEDPDARAAAAAIAIYEVYDKALYGSAPQCLDVECRAWAGRIREGAHVPQGRIVAALCKLGWTRAQAARRVGRTKQNARRGRRLAK